MELDDSAPETGGANDQRVRIGNLGRIGRLLF